MREEAERKTRGDNASGRGVDNSTDSDHVASLAGNSLGLSTPTKAQKTKKSRKNKKNKRKNKKKISAKYAESEMSVV